MKKLSKILLAILIVFLNINIYNAQVYTKNRNSLSNYGVNKKWNINNNHLDNILNTPYVDASEKVYDFSEILTVTEENVLKQKIDNFVELTNMDMVIVTENIPYSIDTVNEEYAADFYDYNDFGIDFTNLMCLEVEKKVETE